MLSNIENPKRVHTILPYGKHEVNTASKSQEDVCILL